jgi:UDP-glucose 4-epimerase
MPPTDGAVKARRAVVTGGAGFVGSHLVDRLLGDGWQVQVIDDLSTGVAGNLAPTVRLEPIDIADGDVEQVMRAWRPQAVYHLAAQASLPASLRNPLRDLTVNVIGTHRVAEAARRANAARLVFVSSGGAIYGESVRAATERTMPAPASYYGVHKLAAEGHVALAGLPYAIARPSNIYGPRQSPGLEGAVVAAFVARALAHQPLVIHGTGEQTRDFVHVHDVVDALIRVGQVSAPEGTWNIAAGRQTSILALAARVEQAAGTRLGRVHRAARPGDVRRSAASPARLEGLGWRPSVTLSRGIQRLISGEPTAS